ncbi:hypothetical protein ABZP36_007408 [Zizania latifolia]
MASGGIARSRLAEERKAWRKNHPHGFVARPETLPDGSVNLMVWRCIIPGREGGFAIPDANPCSYRKWRIRNCYYEVKFNRYHVKLANLFHFTHATALAGAEFVALKTHNLTSPPSCKFPSGFFHINVYDCGAVCLSILSSGWKPSITVKQILVGIQELFDSPNPNSAAQEICFELYIKNMPEYRSRVRQQAKRYPSVL